jgi:hypothetical protein
MEMAASTSLAKRECYLFSSGGTPHVLSCMQMLPHIYTTRNLLCNSFYKVVLSGSFIKVTF